MWFTNPQEFCFGHFTINTVWKMTNIVYSGMTCSEQPFINVTLSPIANTTWEGSDKTSPHLVVFQGSIDLWQPLPWDSDTFVFIYLPDGRDIYWICVKKPTVIAAQTSQSDSSHRWVQNTQRLHVKHWELFRPRLPHKSIMLIWAF